MLAPLPLGLLLLLLLLDSSSSSTFGIIAIPAMIPEEEQ